jgi:hypothetical protein
MTLFSVNIPARATLPQEFQAVFRIHIGFIPAPVFYLRVDPDPGSQFNAERFGSWSDFAAK